MGIVKKDFARLINSNMKIYADEVNEQRAIPSIYDGLKPSQRRVLYWLYKNKGMKDFLGCAQIVGGTLGDFHPHGDSSVYGALVRMSQPLIMSYPLIDFQGNNGSITDPPAAMRYTKAKLSSYGKALLTDLDTPGVIQWGQNYLETIDEPKYLLGALGTLNLLINPQIGIGVGLASNWTCHNIEDVKALVKYRMEHPNCSFEELPQIYPSFHNAGILINSEDIPNIYKTGKGTVVLRSKYKWDGDILYITELPYRVDATNIKKYLVQHPIDGINEIYEQEGKLKIYTNKGINKDVLLEKLWKKTNLQSSYQINMTATGLDGKPKVWTLIEILDTHIALQHNRITKRAEHAREQSQHALHIDEGLIKALDIIDEVIAIIKNSDSTLDAKLSLIDRLGIDDEQAKAILDIRLAKLAKMEIDTLRQEIEGYMEDIKYQTSIIESKEIREEIYNGEMAIYVDKTPHTECQSLISVPSVGARITSDFYSTITPNELIIDLDDGQEKVSKNDTLIIITSNFRGIRREAKDLVLGETKWEDIVKLQKGETMIVANWLSDIQNYETFTATVNGSNFTFATDVLTLGATARGKKLLAGKDLTCTALVLND